MPAPRRPSSSSRGSLHPLGALLFALLALAPARDAMAHRINLFAWTEGKEVVGEAYFSGGARAMNIPVDVFRGETKLLSTRTNAGGEFRFSAPAGGDIRILVDTGDGHRAEFPFQIGDPAAGAAGTKGGGASAAATGPAVKSDASLPELSLSQLEERIDAMMERKLTPIRKDLALMKQQPVSLRDVTAGVGFILGIFGAAALVSSRRGKSG